MEGPAEGRSKKVWVYERDQPDAIQVNIPKNFEPDLKDPKFRTDTWARTVYHVIGKGSQAKVIAAVKKDKHGNEVRLACKRYDCSRASECKLILRELQISQFLEHKHIARLYEYFYDEGPTGKLEYLWLVMERASMSLDKFYDSRVQAREPRKYSHENLEKLLYQMLLAIDHLHMIGIIHRDITPKNIGILLLRSGFEHTTEPRTPKIYYPPEALLPKPEYDARIDVWCAALVLLEAFGEQPPSATGPQERFKLMKPSRDECVAFHNNVRLAVEYKHNFVLGKHPKPPEFDNIVKKVIQEWCHVPDNPDETARKNAQLLKLLRSMLARDPKSRPYTSQCLEDEYLKIAKEKDTATTATTSNTDQEALQNLHSIVKQFSYNVHV
ncbi:unnamed protein product, partial [Mesorhabditis spiculigera]